MTERNEYVEAAGEKLTDGEMVERFTHPTHGSAEHVDGAGEGRDGHTSRAPEQ